MRKRALSVFLILFIILLSSCTKNDIETSGNRESDLVVKVTGIDGKTSTVDLRELTYVTGNGGLKKSTGTIIGPGQLKGPKVMDILAVVGGIKEGQAVQLIADDGYELILTYEEINGDVPTYNEQGEEISMDGLEAIIALEFSENINLPSKPTIAFIGEALTDGQLWLRGIKEIKILE